MNKEIDKSLEEVINYIKSKKEYQKCIDLKKKMNNNKELTTLINDIKKKQKEYINSGNSVKLEKGLKKLNNELDKYPIYIEYNNNLKTINEDIEILKKRLNDYFTSVIEI
ncbi:MAG: YlbF family regulator [Bacilli bacterium]|nr:YlbF family regulator [Bacilli bacterium]